MVTGSVPLGSGTSEPPVILYAPEKLHVSLSLLSLSAVCQPAFGTGSELSSFQISLPNQNKISEWL